MSRIRTPIVCVVIGEGGSGGALGIGIGLLLSEKLRRDARRGAGCALLAVGALTTIPLAMELFGKLRTSGVSE